jgi:hypothetical protein
MLCLCMMLQPACAAAAVHSSPGLFGSLPWIDRARGYWGVSTLCFCQPTWLLSDVACCCAAASCLRRTIQQTIWRSLTGQRGAIALGSASTHCACFVFSSSELLDTLRPLIIQAMGMK